MVIRTNLVKHGNAIGIRLPKEMLAQAGLRRGDEVSLTLRDDRTVEIRRSDGDDQRLQDAFAWVLSRYANTLKALAK